MKQTMKERLEAKTVQELKAIYVRLNGKDLLRGSKQEMVNTLLSNLNTRKVWAQISQI